MNYAEEQAQELDALQAIYPDELEIECDQYPSISITLTVSSNAADSLHSPPTESEQEESGALWALLRVRFGPEYPEKEPELEVESLDELAGQERADRTLQLLKETAEENKGMAVVFTIVSALQEQLGMLTEEIAADREAQKERIRLAEEEKEKMRVVGTPVTVEAFLNWKARFDEEMQEKRRRMKLEREKALGANKRLTGREQFLRDATLNLSDMKLLEEDQDMKIDESLFEDLDDLDIDDED